MTLKEIEKIGFIKIRSRQNMYILPFGFYDTPTDVSIYIDSQMTVKDIIHAYYSFGVDKGIEIGKQQKVKEFKQLLEIEDDN